jgi:hypothetical protein
MVKLNKLPHYTDFFTAADSAYTGWLASHPRSLLAGSESGARRDTAKTEHTGRFILAGGDEPGEKPLPNTRCELLSGNLQQARVEASQADVMRRNWKLQAESHERELNRINAQLDAIFARLQEIDREHDERFKGVDASPDADPKKPPQSWFRDKSWPKGAAKQTGWAMLNSMLEEHLSRAQAEGKKSAHAERTRELLEERRVVEEGWAQAEAKRREEEAKFQAARTRIDAIRGQMKLHGCSTPHDAHG